MSTNQTYGSVPSTRRREPLWTFLVPLAISVVMVVASLVVMWLIKDDLPDLIARHWGADGEADGFSTLGSYMAFATIFPIALALVMGVLGRATTSDRIMGPIVVGMTASFTVMMTLSLLAQRGLADGSEARTDSSLWWGLAAGVMAGVGMVLVMRRRPSTLDQASGPLPDGAETLDVSQATKLVWTGHTRVERMMWVVVAFASAPLAIMVIVFLLQKNWSLALFILLTGMVIVVTVSAVYSRVTVDTAGVRVVGLGLIRWATLPLSNLQGATVTKVSPLGDFGGYGRRIAMGGELEGVVTGEGEAIRITRAGLRPFVITVDDAKTAAATLNTLIARTRPPRFDV